MPKQDYGWINFYMEFATELLTFKEKRNELIQKIKTIYDNIGMKLPKLESDNNPRDIDPFTIYGLFNKGISEVNRKAILSGIAAEFGIKSSVPDSFAGIPVVNNLRATFYWFQEERDAQDINHLWNLFEMALSLAQTPSDLINRQSFIDCYDVVRGQQGVQWNITMALYWIRPYVFLNLDSKNRSYITNPMHMPADFVVKVKPILNGVPSGKQYLDIIHLCKLAMRSGNYPYKDFPQLSCYAWNESEELNILKKDKNGQKKNPSNAAHIRWTGAIVQALRDLGGSGTPAAVRAKIVENEHLTQEEIRITRGKTNVNKFENEVAFARNDLAAGGYIDRSIHGVWTLTDAGKSVEITKEMASDLFKNTVALVQAKRDSKNDVLADNGVSTVCYWVYAPGHSAEKWDECYEKGIMLLGWGELGDLKAFESKADMKEKLVELYGPGSYINSAHATWQFAYDMKPGDVVYVKKGLYEIVGRGIVASDYEYDAERTDSYNNFRQVNWTHKGSWTLTFQTAQKTLTDITPYGDTVQQIKALFEETALDEEDEEATDYPLYSLDDFLDEVFMDKDTYEKIVAVLKHKKNIILQGAPGVGKTFVAKRLAYAIMGKKDVERVMMVQFHQSYSYEDFIMGFRPTATGFELRRGAFYNFCKKAEIDSDNEYFFIIDEINRGNLNKIFGELFMLIENDKRGIELQLLYSDEKFAVPKNVYIVGMMNTADRSLAILDYALRRRFAFIELRPAFEAEGFKLYRSNLDNAKIDRLIACVQNLNKAIAADESLGGGFCIGHSYFCNLTPEEITSQNLAEIVEYELIPLLREYWFDEPIKVDEWSENLRSAIK